MGYSNTILKTWIAYCKIQSQLWYANVRSGGGAVSGRGHGFFWYMIFICENCSILVNINFELVNDFHFEQFEVIFWKFASTPQDTCKLELGQFHAHMVSKNKAVIKKNDTKFYLFISYSTSTHLGDFKKAKKLWGFPMRIIDFSI